MEELLKEYADIKSRIDALEQEKNRIRDAIIGVATHEGIKSGEFGSHKFVLQERESVKCLPSLLPYLESVGLGRYIKKSLDASALKKDMESFDLPLQEEIVARIENVSTSHVLSVKSC